MAVVADGIYLEINRPVRDQSQARRNDVQSVISIHTAQSGTDFVGPDPKAENVARFIQGRLDPGSYHLLGDADSIIQLLDMELEAFQSRGGSNRFVISISLAMNAEDWGKLSRERRAQLVDTAGQMAAIAARWLQERGLPIPAAVRLTKAQAFKRGASGFIDHARLDPDRRTDPGDGFPWSEFFQSYHAHLTQTGGIDNVAELTVLEEQVMDLQRLLASWGVDLGETGPNDDGVDGDPGGVTIAGSSALIRHLINELHKAREQVELVKAGRAESQILVTRLQETNRGQATHISQLEAQNAQLREAQQVDAQQVGVWKAKEAELGHIKQLIAQLKQVL